MTPNVMTLHITTHLDWVVLQVDIASAFNIVSHKVIL